MVSPMGAVKLHKIFVIINKFIAHGFPRGEMRWINTGKCVEKMGRQRGYCSPIIHGNAEKTVPVEAGSRNGTVVSQSTVPGGLGGEVQVYANEMKVIRRRSFCYQKRIYDPRTPVSVHLPARLFLFPARPLPYRGHRHRA